MAVIDDLDIPVYVDLRDGNEPFRFRPEDSAVIELDADDVVAVEPLDATPIVADFIDPRIRVLEGLLAQVQERRRSRR